TNRVATLNAQAQQPVLALLGSEALVGDALFHVSKFSRPQPGPAATNQTPFVEGVRAEKQLTNGLRLVKEFELGSNYLVHVQCRLENRSEQPVALPPEEWVAGTATPLNPQDDELLVGLIWYNGSQDKQVGR